jgi:hypothetical protein
VAIQGLIQLGPSVVPWFLGVGLVLLVVFVGRFVRLQQLGSFAATVLEAPVGSLPCAVRVLLPERLDVPYPRAWASTDDGHLAVGTPLGTLRMGFATTTARSLPRRLRHRGLFSDGKVSVIVMTRTKHEMETLIRPFLDR